MIQRPLTLQEREEDWKSKAQTLDVEGRAAVTKVLDDEIEKINGNECNSLIIENEMCFLQELKTNVKKGVMTKMKPSEPKCIRMNGNLFILFILFIDLALMHMYA